MHKKILMQEQWEDKINGLQNQLQQGLPFGGFPKTTQQQTPHTAKLRL